VKRRQLSALSCLFASFALAMALCSSLAQTPAPNTTQWENDSLKLRLFYPSDLTEQPAAKAVQDGHFALLGLPDIAPDAKAADLTRCLRPMLLLNLPPAGPAQATSQPTPDGGAKVTVTPALTANLLLAELDVTCLSSQHPSGNTDLLARMAGSVNDVPGMKPIAPPSTYTIGWQTVHMAAAQGQPQLQSGVAASKSSSPQQLFTMGISTNWHSHLLVWYLSSNSIDMLNRITKTTVRFGRSRAEPLYPIVIGTTAR